MLFVHLESFKHLKPLDKQKHIYLNTQFLIFNKTVLPRSFISNSFFKKSIAFVSSLGVPTMFVSST